MPNLSLQATAVSADGWDTPAGFLSGPPATTSGSATPDAHVTFLATPLPTGAALTGLKVSLTAGAVPSGGALPAIDQVRLTVGGAQVGDPQYHGSGIGTPPAEYVAEWTGADLAAAGVTRAVIVGGTLGVATAFYDSTAADSGSADWSAGPVAAVLTYTT